MGVFKRKGCAIWSPNFVLSAGFETLCLPDGNDLCEFTVMWDDTQACWSASARGASQRIMLQDLAWHDCWVNQQLSGCNLPMKRKAMLNSWAAGQSERVSPCPHHRNREWSKLQGTPEVISPNLLPKTGLTELRSRCTRYFPIDFSPGMKSPPVSISLL